MDQHDDHEKKPGMVYLIGAGPGDPGLITLRAAECLRWADVVLYDYLVNPAILEHATSSAECVCLGHHCTGRAMTQQQVNARMVEEAKRQRTVVRLKGGDPSVFGHLAEEIAALSDAGIAFEIVPGVTAAFAASACTAIPLTAGAHASAVALVTGQQRPSELGAELDYEALAKFPGTLVFYMGTVSARQWSRALVDHGKSQNTPVVIVRRCTWPDQQAIRCTLGEVADVIQSQGLRPPAVIVVGEVARLGLQVLQFAERPLLGTRILVTRPREEAASLRSRLRQLGAEVLLQPAIEIADPPDWIAVDAALSRLDQYDWLVFSSVHGVRYFLDRLLSLGGDLRRLGRSKLAAVGPGTAEQLAAYHLRVDLVPAEYRAESLAEALSREASGRRFLLPRANRGRDVLAEQLAQSGGVVEQIVAYENRDVRQPQPEVAAAVRAGQIDWITVTSSAIARSLAGLFGADLRKAKLVSISPITSATLRADGFEPAAEASPHTMEGLIAAICRARSPGRSFNS